jgi:hypothetical protein
MRDELARLLAYATGRDPVAAFKPHGDRRPRRGGRRAPARRSRNPAKVKEKKARTQAALRAPLLEPCAS